MTRDYMERALFHAARGARPDQPEPDGRRGRRVGRRRRRRAGLSRARRRAARRSARARRWPGARARGATLYCTLEPCCHVGRTGPCVDRIVEAGIARVVAAIEDPESARCSGRGFAFLREHGVAVDVGLGREQPTRLNQPFFTLMRERRPFVILKAATSLDGCIAEAPGARTTLTSAAANRHAHAFRAEVDAIGVGVGTVLADDPLLTARGRLPRAAADAGGLRPPAAHAAARARCSRHARPGLSSS